MPPPEPELQEGMGQAASALIFIWQSSCSSSAKAACRLGAAALDRGYAAADSTRAV